MSVENNTKVTIGATEAQSADQSHERLTFDAQEYIPPSHVSAKHIPPSRGYFRLKTEDMGDGEIKMGTLAGGGGSFRDVGEKLSEKNKDKLAAKQAFAQLKALLKASGYPNLQRMTIDVDSCTVSLNMGRPKRTEDELSLDEVKAAIATFMHEGNPIGREKAEQEVCRIFGEIKYAFKRAGIDIISHYDPHGPDKRGSEIGGAALEKDRHKHPLIQAKQSSSLVQDANYKKKQDKFISFIADQIPDRTKQKEAVQRVIGAEIVAIHLRDRFSAKVTELTAAYRNNPNEETRRTLQHFKHIMNELKQADRTALWMTAVYPDPQECYGKVLQYYYDLTYADTKPEDKPAFEEFCQSPDSRPFRPYAAEVASTLIANPKEYRLFCRKYDIEPRENHINAFINQVIKDPRAINFACLDHIHLNEGERTVVTEIATASKGEIASLPNKIRRIDKRDMTANDLLEATVADKEHRIGNLLRDNSYSPPGISERISTSARNLFHTAAGA